MTLWVLFIVMVVRIAAFVGTYWWAFLALFIVWALALNGFRSEHRVFKDLTVSGKLLPTLRAILGSELTVYLTALVLGVVTACSAVNALDNWLQSRIGGDAVAVGDRIGARAAYRLHARGEDLLKRLYLRGVGRGGKTPLPGWARRTPAERNGIDFRETWKAPSDQTVQDGDLVWRAFKIVKAPGTKRRDSIRMLGRLTPRADGKPIPPDETKRLQDQLRQTFGLDAGAVEFERQCNVLRNLLIAPPPTGFAEPDLDDFDLLFQVMPDDKSLRLQPYVADFLQKQTAGGFLGPALGHVYAPPTASFAVGGPAGRKAAVDDLFTRLGTAFEDPTAKEVADQIKVEARSLVRRIESSAGREKAERFVYMLLVMGLTPGSVSPGQKTGAGAIEKAPAPVDSAEYDLGGLEKAGGQELEKAVSSKLPGKIERGIVHAVENNSSGDKPFTLKVTYIRLRSMVRGPIQLVTLAIFFTGMILLVVKGYILGVWTQLSYLPFRMQPFTRLADPYDIRWHEIWRDQREIGNADPVARQVVASGEHADDLLPFLLRRVFGSLESGGGLEGALAMLEQASSDWLEDRDREYVILDYLEYLLPALGFIGTLIGNGQGLSIANQVVLPDPETQAESISTMTSHLGMAFYATLIALCCAIPYLFCRSLLSRMQLLVVQVYKAKLKRYLLSHVVMRSSIPGDPTTGLNLPPASPAPGLPAEPAQVFVEVMALLIHRTHPTALERVFPSDVLGAGLPDNCSLLARVLIAAGAIQPNYWDYYSRNVLAYSMFPPLIDELPDHWMHLGHVLYCLEVRPMQTFLSYYGLPFGFDPTRNPPQQPHALKHDPDDFFDFIKECLEDFGNEYLKGKERRTWKALCNGRWQRLADLKQGLIGLRKVGEDYHRELAFLELVEGSRPAVRLLLTLADAVPGGRRSAKRRRLLALLANPPHKVGQGGSWWF